jgi:hypothetical protein
MRLLRLLVLVLILPGLGLSALSPAGTDADPGVIAPAVSLVVAPEPEPADTLAARTSETPERASAGHDRPASPSEPWRAARHRALPPARAPPAAQG